MAVWKGYHQPSGAKEDIDRANVEIQQAELDYDLNKAAWTEIWRLIYQQYRSRWKPVGANTNSGQSLLREEVAEADICGNYDFPKWTGIDQQISGYLKKKKLYWTEDELHYARLSGQDEAVTAYCEGCNSAGQDLQIPIARLLASLEPTGVGKTELAKPLLPTYSTPKKR